MDPCVRGDRFTQGEDQCHGRAMMLLMHTMLPIAPPTDCRASTLLPGRPTLCAMLCWMLPKVRFDTVFEPEKKAPIAPR